MAETWKHNYKIMSGRDVPDRSVEIARLQDLTNTSGSLNLSTVLSTGPQASGNNIIIDGTADLVINSGASVPSNGIVFDTGLRLTSTSPISGRNLAALDLIPQSPSDAGSALVIRNSSGQIETYIYANSGDLLFARDDNGTAALRLHTLKHSQGEWFLGDEASTNPGLGLQLANDIPIVWSDAASIFSAGSLDVGISRSGVGVLSITDGSMAVGSGILWASGFFASESDTDGNVTIGWRNRPTTGLRLVPTDTIEFVRNGSTIMAISSTIEGRSSVFSGYRDQVLDRTDNFTISAQSSKTTYTNIGAISGINGELPFLPSAGQAGLSFTFHCGESQVLNILPAASNSIVLNASGVLPTGIPATLSSPGQFLTLQAMSNDTWGQIG